MIADDLVAAQQVFVDASPDGSHEDLLRAIGTMFAQMEGYAADADEDDGPTFFVSIPNRAPNPNFEHDQVGAAPAGYDTSGWTTYVVANNWSQTGLHSLRLTATSFTSGQNADLRVAGPGSTTAGAIGSFSVKAGQYVALRYRGKINTLSGDWYLSWRLRMIDPTTGTAFYDNDIGGPHPVAGQQYDITWMQLLPTNFDTFLLEIYVRAHCIGAGSLDMNVDNVGVYLDPAGVVPAYNDPDLDSTWEWAGAPGNSQSQPTPPISQVGWRKMLDVDQADAFGLPYLAQWIGERISTGMSDLAARQLIRKNPNAYRGSPSAIAHGIMPLLTGTQSVFTKERAKNDGTTNVDWLAVLTYASETPNQQQVQDRLRRLLTPGDIMLDYSTIARNTWATIQAGTPSWTTVQSGRTWNTIETNLGLPVGYTLWTPS